MLINKNTFAFKLNLYVVSLITLIALVIFASFYFVSRNMLLSSVEQNAKNIAENNVNKIDAVISECSKIPFNFASVIENLDLSEEQLINQMELIVKKNKEVYGTTIAFEPFMYKDSRYYFAPFIYRKDGEIIKTNLNNPDYAYFFQDWYQIPKYLNEPVWSEPYYDEGGGNALLITYSVPFYKEVKGTKKLWGIVSVDIALDWLTDIVSSIKIYDSGFAFVVSQNGAIVTHPNKDFILNESIFSLAEENNIPELREIGRKMLKEESGFEEVRSITLSGKSRIYYTPFHSNNWSLAVMFPENELYADLNNLSLMIVVIGILGFILLIFTITSVSKKLTEPLSSFSKAAKQIGLGEFNIKLPDVNSSDEIGELRNSFKKMQNELATYIENLKNTTAEKEKMQSELRIAHQIQMGMIPKIFPAFPDRDDVDLHAFLDPAKEVGGDLYDFFFIDDNKLVVTVGDVAGKGVPASLFMAVTRTLIRSKMTKGVRPAEIIDSINEDLMGDNDSKLFVTLLLCVIDLNTREVEYTNAGHNYPYIVSEDGSIKTLKEKHGMAVGLFKIKPYLSGKFLLQPHDKIVLYTDGVNEAMNINDELYDYERFEKCMSRINTLTAKESTQLILNDIKTFTGEAEQSDDITLLILELKE
jgi:phosphoserine phosphatase RsbU/P